MSLLDTFNLSQDHGFQERVRAAFVQAAVNVFSEVANEVQSLSISGGPTGGTFTLKDPTGAGTTATIAWNANAATVQTALQALTQIGNGNVVCTGGPLPGTAVSVTFAGTLGNLPLNLITVGTNSLTGGSSPAPSVSRTTAGVAVVNHAARVALASKLVVASGPTDQQLAIAVATNATILADFPAVNGNPNTGGYQPMGALITGATNANPIVITSANHGLASSQSVTITGVAGNTAANGTWTVTKIDANTFSIPVTGNGSYTSGGAWVLSETQLSNDIQFTTNSTYTCFT